MSRSLVFALALGLFAPLAHAQDGDGRLATLDPELTAGDETFAEDAGDEDQDYEDEEAYDDEDYGDEDVEYCGGGDMSVVDEVWDEMEYGDAGRAYENLVAALRGGEVEDWERGRALSILAELQLRRGEPGRALVNFERAERIDPGITEASRVAIATALYLRGERVQAQREAQVAHDELCSDEYAVAGCYTANLILARIAPAADARVAASDAAASLRGDYPDLESAFDAADAQVRGS
ncbi:MAG: hypothetical protein H6719_18545 [Sandaracinaceae bacterium]|nr:hypothetical protein [Sandaracinaceae bacterium]